MSLLEYARGPQPTTFDNYVDRYYNQYLAENCKNVSGNNCRILQHSNGMCILCVDPSHTALRKVADSAGSVVVASVTFGSSKGEFAPDSVKVVGKKKKNGRMCQQDMRLLTIKLSDDSEYPIPACLHGFILEMNTALLDSPWLLSAAPLAEGFVAIINVHGKMKLSVYKLLRVATAGDAHEDENDDA